MSDPRKLAVEALENAGWSSIRAQLIVNDLEAAGVVFAAPVDGELREALVDALVMTPLSDMAGTEMTPFYRSVDALLPIIAAHVAGGERALREEIAAEIEKAQIERSAVRPVKCIYGHRTWDYASAERAVQAAQRIARGEKQ